MVRHNNEIPNNHFKKKWQIHVRTWFDQPGRKLRRRNARAAKAQKLFPRPVGGVLKPVVRGQTLKYNNKTRLGRGFTLVELKEAGISAKLAPTIGISVDHRRRNKSMETLQENVNRLKAYKSNLVIFPRNAKKPKNFETALAEAKLVPQLSGLRVMPLVKEKPTTTLVKVTRDLKEVKAYAKLRIERMNERMVGVRAKRAKETEAKQTE